MKRFLLVGLTGGIATGKSTVTGLLANPSVRVVDADALAREVVEPGTPAHTQIVVEFGKDVLQPDGRLDRARLGEIVFPDPAKRKRLEAITHPAIRARFEKIMADLERQGFDGLLIWDAALLVESGGHKKMDKVVVVTTDPATQLRRLMARDGSTEEAARARTASQTPLAVKVGAGDYVIDNSGTREETEKRVREVYGALLEDLGHQQAPR
jgi:dephospho-CoA kinase